MMLYHSLAVYGKCSNVSFYIYSCSFLDFDYEEYKCKFSESVKMPTVTMNFDDLQ